MKNFLINTISLLAAIIFLAAILFVLSPLVITLFNTIELKPSGAELLLAGVIFLSAILNIWLYQSLTQTKTNLAKQEHRNWQQEKSHNNWISRQASAIDQYLYNYNTNYQRQVIEEVCADWEKLNQIKKQAFERGERKIKNGEAIHINTIQTEDSRRLIKWEDRIPFGIHRNNLDHYPLPQNLPEHQTLGCTNCYGSMEVDEVLQVQIFDTVEQEGNAIINATYHKDIKCPHCKADSAYIEIWDTEDNNITYTLEEYQSVQDQLNEPEHYALTIYAEEETVSINKD